MIYSVPTRDNTYRYFEGPGEFPPTGAFRKPRGSPIAGLFPPQRFLPLLPSGCVEVGAGPEGRGVLAAVPQGFFEGLPAPVKDLGRGLAWTLLGWGLKTLWKKL